MFDDPKAHAAAPLAVYTLLAGGVSLRVETADLGDVGRGAFDRDRGAVSILRPPEFTYASAVVRSEEHTSELQSLCVISYAVLHGNL